MEEFRFLKPRKMKHPTTGIDLEYLDKSNAVCIALFNEEKDKIMNKKEKDDEDFFDEFFE